MDRPPVGLDPALRRKRFQAAGVLVLIVGVLSAAVVYWRGTRSPDLSDDPSMLGFNRAEERQMGLLYGKMGSLIEGWKDDLKKPGTQATLIMLAALAVAGGCFFVSRLPDGAPPG